MKKLNFKWEIQISNMEKISNLKIYLTQLDNDIIPSKDKIRLFFGGKELKDNKKISTYKLEDGSFVQML